VLGQIKQARGDVGLTWCWPRSSSSTWPGDWNCRTGVFAGISPKG